LTVAIVLIALAAFGARIFVAARSMRHPIVPLLLIAAAIGAYALPFVAGYRLEQPLIALHARSGAVLLVLADALLLALGFFVPVLLQQSEDPRSRTRLARFFVAILLTLFVLDLGGVVHRLGPMPALAPELWFVIGIAAFLVIRLRFFEDA